MAEANAQRVRQPSADQVVASVQTLVDMLEDSPVVLEDFTAAATARGWTAPSEPDLFTTDLPTATGRISVSSVDGHVWSALLKFTQRDPNASDFFAVYADGLSEAWGAPVKRRRGKIPTICWELPQVFVTLRNYRGSLMVEVFDPEAYRIQLAAGNI